MTTHTTPEAEQALAERAAEPTRDLPAGIRATLGLGGPTPAA